MPDARARFDITNPPEHAVLARLLAEAAVLHGNFTLRSGRTSRYYIDKYRFTTRPDLLAGLASMLANRVVKIEADTGPIDLLAGPELGGVPIATALALATGTPTVLVRNQKKTYGSANRLEGLHQRGQRVVLIEDIATSGGQAVEAIAALREVGLVVAAAFVVVDRGEGGRAAVEATGVPFDALFTSQDLGIDAEITSE